MNRQSHGTLTVILMLLLLGGCMGCAPRKTITLGSTKPDSLHVWYSPKSMDNMLKWHMYTRDDNGSKVEMAFCVYGYTEKDWVYIQHLEMAMMGGQAHESIQHMGINQCEHEGLIGWGHTHPDNTCSMSPVDVQTAVSLPLEYSFVVCAGRTPDEIGVSFYTKRFLLRFLRNMQGSP